MGILRGAPVIGATASLGFEGITFPSREQFGIQVARLATACAQPASSTVTTIAGPSIGRLFDRALALKV